MKENEMNYKYIAVEGNIGVGKTSLADQLAKDFNATIIHEQFEDNELLAPFYKDPKKLAFQLEMSFLDNRFNQLSDNVLFSHKSVVSDYHFGKSLVFASNNLNKAQFEEFKKAYDLLYQKLHKPDLIIYLRNEVPNLQKNIRKRGRPYEQRIQDQYLQNISKLYDRFFTEMEEIPILWIEISGSDFMNNIQKIRKSLDMKLPAGVSKIKLQS